MDKKYQTDFQRLIPWSKESPYDQQSTQSPQSKVFHQLNLKMSSEK